MQAEPARGGDLAMRGGRVRTWSNLLCNLRTFTRSPTLVLCVNVTVHAPVEVSVCINCLYVVYVQVCSAGGAGSALT